MEPAVELKRTDARLPRWLLAVVVGIGILAYAGGLSGPFIFDDIGSIPDNPNIRRLWPPLQAMSGPAGTTITGRPVVCLSLAINYAIGGLTVLGYHLGNLGIHLCSALLLLGIIRRTLLAPIFEGRFDRSAPWLAAASATIWMVHPLQTEAVTYVIQRTELLMGFFYLSTVYAAIRGWESPSHRRAWFVVSVVCCALGMGSKEAMIFAPLIVLMYDRTFRSRSWKASLQQHWSLYAGLGATWLILAWLVALGARRMTAGWGLEISPLDYIKTQTGVIVWYLRLCFWPHPLVISYDDWPVAHRVAQIWPQGLLLLVLLSGTLWGLRRRSALGFLGAWFFLILAPTSSLLPIVTEVAAERRMYLPLAAVVVLTVGIASLLLHAISARMSLSPAANRRLGVGLTVVVVAGLGYGTAWRNRDYRTAAAIWADTAAKRPGIAFAHFELANALAAEGRLDDAIACYAKALQLKPAYPDAHNNFANVLADQGRTDEAIQHYEEAISLRPAWAEAYNNLGTILTSQGRLTAAVLRYTEALRLKPHFAEAHSNLGVTLMKLGRAGDAITHFREAVNAAPDLAQPHFNLAEALAAKGRLEEAIEQYRQALRLDPAHPAARTRLEAALAKRAPGHTP